MDFDYSYYIVLSNFTPSLMQPFSQQTFTTQNVKVVNIQKNEVTKLQDLGNTQYIILNFSWTPLTPKKNAIFGIVYSFEYSIDNLQQNNPELSYILRLNDFQAGSTNSDPDTSGAWETVSFQTTSNNPNFPEPNQTEYPINLQIGVFGYTETYIRNVNLMMLVIDG